MSNLVSNELYHHGILGMKWGIRRYQNADGTLTEAGKKRYQNWDGTPTKEGKKLYSIPHWKKGYIPPEKRAYDANGKLTPAGQDGKEVFDDLMRKYYPDEKSIRNEEARRQKYDEEYHKWYFSEDSSKAAILKKKLRELDADDKMNTIMDEAKEILKEKGSILVPEKGNYGDIADVMLRLHEDSFYDRTKFPEQKKASLDRAAKNDSWELNFLETVQNDPVLQKGGKELLSEYSKYLDNPRKYMHEFDKSDYFKKNPHLDHEDQDEDHLEHWGILGMKWGVRRYQNKDGSLTSAGRSRYGSGKEKVGILEAHRIKKRKAEAAKKRAETLAKKKAEEEDAQKHEAEKQEAIRSGNATQIAKFQNELSNQELRDALDRLNSKQRLSDLVDKETPKKETKLDKAMKIADKASKYADVAEKGIKAYNTFAKITNTFADDDSQLPIIGEKKEKRNLSKEEAIKSGDPKILEAWKGKLSKDEVVQAYTIANNWQKIADMKLNSEQKKVLEQAGKTVIDDIASRSSSNDSGSKSETKPESKPVSALDAYEKAYDTRSSYKSFEKEMKPKEEKKEKTSIFKPKEPEKYEYKPSTYDPNERQSALWRSSFNPAESKKQDREAQQKRVDDLISKYSTSAGSDWNNYQSEQAYKKAKDESHLSAKQIINNILEDEERKRKS